MGTEEEHEERIRNAYSIINLISGKIYEGAAGWDIPPFRCLYDRRNNPVLLIISDNGNSGRYSIVEASTGRGIDQLVREGRIRKERNKFINTKDAIPI